MLWGIICSEKFSILIFFFRVDRDLLNCENAQEWEGVQGMTTYILLILMCGVYLLVGLFSVV